MGKDIICDEIIPEASKPLQDRYVPPQLEPMDFAREVRIREVHLSSTTTIAEYSRFTISVRRSTRRARYRKNSWTTSAYTTGDCMSAPRRSGCRLIGS